MQMAELDRSGDQPSRVSIYDNLIQATPISVRSRQEPAQAAKHSLPPSLNLDLFEVQPAEQFAQEAADLQSCIVQMLGSEESEKDELIEKLQAKLERLQRQNYALNMENRQLARILKL